MDRVNFPKLQRTAFAVASVLEPSDEKLYSLSKTPYGRIEAVELMRQIIYGYDPSAPDFKEFLRLLNAHIRTWPT
jgi:hypothetical protein